MTAILDLVRALPWNKKLEVLRIAKDWSQEVAARECGTTKKNYWLWEMGRTIPRFNSKRAIAIAFKVSMEDIFGEPHEKQAI
jgi:DNA-binding XRE family transcriptional regulator